MTPANALRIVSRLKAAFPMMALDETQTKILVREVALLADASILDEAASNLIRREERFPTIALIRSAYRGVATSRDAARPLPEPPRDGEIPEWVHVWAWQMQRTRAERQASNTMSRQKADERAPVRMRGFPQMENPYPADGGAAVSAGPDAYTVNEYEQLRAEWVEADAPKLRDVAEVMRTVGT